MLSQSFTNCLSVAEVTDLVAGENEENRMKNPPNTLLYLFIAANT